MKRLLVVAGVTTAMLVPAVAASAHPLGNFTVNHYDGLTVTPKEIVDHAVVDFAEIPTAQNRGSVDANYAATTCEQVARDVDVTVDGHAVQLIVTRSAFGYRPGAAGLQTSRLDCMLSANVALSSRVVIAISDSYDADRIGWHEITAVGDGVRLLNSPVPEQSVSDELQHYPNDLLSSPLSVRSAELTVLAGAGASTMAGHLPRVHQANLVVRTVEGLSRFLSTLAGSRHLTVGVGFLAVLVSLLLGAAHAALPGHGKTVMAAYLAGKHGSRRDAIVVGATVTVTHTAGVLLLGLALSLSSSLAGERVSTLLGAVSGGLLVVVGAGLLMSALRQRRGAGEHDHHDHEHAHEHPHKHAHPHLHAHPQPAIRPKRRAALVGMGVAGGLVPSPSALVVLLGAVALGRTAFGVVLVLAYGMGMAATLTAAGLLLVTAVARWSARPRLTLVAARVGALAPATTSVLVLAVGAGLAARSLLALSI